MNANVIWTYPTHRVLKNGNQGDAILPGEIDSTLVQLKLTAAPESAWSDQDTVAYPISSLLLENVPNGSWDVRVKVLGTDPTDNSDFLRTSFTVSDPGVMAPVTSLRVEVF
jgi:hypothetical protein